MIPGIILTSNYPVNFWWKEKINLLKNVWLASRPSCHGRLRGSARVSFATGFWNRDSRWLLVSLRSSSSCQSPNKNRPQRCVSEESRCAENHTWRLSVQHIYRCCLLVKLCMLMSVTFAQRLLMTANTTCMEGFKKLVAYNTLISNRSTSVLSGQNAGQNAWVYVNVTTV